MDLPYTAVLTGMKSPKSLLYNFHVLCRYSRRILWLKVASTNNDPYVIARYFLDCVTELGGRYVANSIIFIFKSI